MMSPLSQSLTVINVIILAPPDFPLPYEVIANLIFLTPGNISIPKNGFCLRSFCNWDKSLRRLLYFLANRFTSLSKSGTVLIVQFI